SRAVGNLDEAERSYRDSMRGWEKLVAAHRGSARYAARLSVTCYNLGRLVLDRGKRDEALQLFGRAAEVMRPVVAAQPKDLEARQRLLEAHWGRSDALTQMGRLTEAIGELDRVLELTGEAGRPLMASQRAVLLARTKLPAEALAAIAPLLARPDAPGAVL